MVVSLYLLPEDALPGHGELWARMGGGLPVLSVVWVDLLHMPVNLQVAG